MENERKPQWTPEQVFGWNVREYRKAKGWSQEQLAQQMTARGYDMHQTTVAKIENAGRPTSIGEAVALAEIFDLEIDELAVGLTVWNAEWGPVDQQIKSVEDELRELTMRLQQARVHAENARQRVALAQAEAEEADREQMELIARNNVLVRRLESLRDMRVRELMKKLGEVFEAATIDGQLGELLDEMLHRRSDRLPVDLETLDELGIEISIDGNDRWHISHKSTKRGETRYQSIYPTEFKTGDVKTVRVYDHSRDVQDAVNEKVGKNQREQD